MKIILIRQAEFRRDAGEDAPAKVRRSDASGYRVYTGADPAGVRTAELLFDPAGPPEITALLDDAPRHASQDTRPTGPHWLQQTLGRVRQAVGAWRRTESGKEALGRAGEFVDLLEAEDRDCVVICAAQTLSALRTVLRRRGYLLEGGSLFPAPLERVRATKRSLHCGGCHHNCLLTEAKCLIGKNKARERGLV